MAYLGGELPVGEPPSPPICFLVLLITEVSKNIVDK